MGGDWHGTVLTASRFSAKRRHLVIHFDRFCMPSGHCGVIDAIAVDLDEGVGAIRGKYRGNYGIRFSGAIAASIVEGYGRAISSGIGNDNVFLDGRLITQQNQRVTSKDALKAASLEVGSTLGSFFREFANRPPVVSKAINEHIGIYVFTPGLLNQDLSLTSAADVQNELNGQIGSISSIDADADAVNRLVKKAQAAAAR
ncbi:MAG: hypothetical protein AAF197_06090 [Pseudomonadota bacterium]